MDDHLVSVVRSIGRRAIPAVLVLVLAGLGPAGASGQQLRHTPTNPHFGGNPFNGAELQSSAAAQRVHRPPAAPAPSSLVANFVNNLEARVSSQLSQYVSTQMFSQTNAGAVQGTFTLGQLAVSYARAGSDVNLVIRDARTGETATVTYPLNMFVP